jgi:hypothetical protein
MVRSNDICNQNSLVRSRKKKQSILLVECRSSKLKAYFSAVIITHFFHCPIYFLVFHTTYCILTAIKNNNTQLLARTSKCDLPAYATL